MQYALSGQPLSQGFRSQLETLFDGTPEYLMLADLRRLGFAKLVRRLASMRGERLVIALESQQASAVLPALFCFAALTAVRKIEVVEPNMARTKVSRWRTVRSLTDALSATASCANAIRKCKRELPKLLAADRIELPPPKPGTVLYAKTNMSFGVKAGGSVGHVAGVCGALAEHGYPVDFLAVEEPVLPRDCVQFHRVPPPAAYGLPYDANLYRYQQVFAKEALRFGADKSHSFIYQRLSLGNYVGPILSRELRLPLVVEYNGSEVWVHKNWDGCSRYLDLAEMADQAMLKHAHLVVTVSDVLRDELIERGVEPRRIVSYPNCIDPEVFDPGRFTAADRTEIRDRWNIPHDARVACFVGTFGQWHGVDVLARAIRQLHEQHADRCRAERLHFMLVGDGILMPRVREELAGVDPTLFTLTGMVPQAEAPAYMNAADMLLSPHVPNPDGSRFFGSPTKLFEYMAMGKPIVASDLEQIGEVLAGSFHASQTKSLDSVGDRLAILTRPESVDDLIAGIQLVLSNEACAEQLGANARRAALAKFTWKQHVAAILDRLEQLS